jgi:predicted  nucleic acid-binding Zn-ribbon protein
MKTLDTRDLQERLEELEALRDSLEAARDLSEELAKDTEATQESIDEADAAERKAEMDYGDDEAEELAEIESLKAEIGAKWKRGVLLIPESDFEDYARELAKDIGAITQDIEWPCNHIDWAAATDSLKMDYTSTTFMSTDYLYRA